MKKSILVISIGAIVSGVSVFALYSGEPKAAQKPAGPVPSVTVGLLAPEAINFAKTIAATGSVHARDELIIGSDASGVRLLEVLVDVGSSVRKGQPRARRRCSAPGAARAAGRHGQAGAGRVRAGARESGARRAPGRVFQRGDHRDAAHVGGHCRGQGRASRSRSSPSSRYASTKPASTRRAAASSPGKRPPSAPWYSPATSCSG